MRMGNPSMRKIMRDTRPGEFTPSSEQSTYRGITWKTLLFGGVTLAAAIVTALLLNVAIDLQNATLLNTVLVAVSLSAVPMLIISLVVVFIPKTVKVLGFVYALLQGALLGCLVFFVDAYYPGIALAAVLATLIVFVVSVVLNKMLEVRISNKFFRGMFIAFVSLIAVELVLCILSLFVDSLSGLFGAYLWIQLGISAFCVFYAAIMLMWDLQNAERIVEMGAPKEFEWRIAFSLVTTIVYMYVEILQLLLRIATLFGRRDG